MNCSNNYNQPAHKSDLNIQLKLLLNKRITDMAIKIRGITMNIIQKAKQYTPIAILLLFSIGMIFLFYNSFAGDTTNIPYATKAQLADEATARTATDTALQNLVNNNALPPLPAERFQVTLTLCGNSDTPQWGPCHYTVGDTGPAGGKVFYTTDGGLHGLEAAPVDQLDAFWGCDGVAITGADGTAIGAGVTDTADILVGCDQTNIAAKIADDYTLNDYNDWFLPSIDELQLLYQHEHVDGGFAFGPYWSSTESDSTNAITLDHGKPLINEKGSTFRVRAIRAF